MLADAPRLASFGELLRRHRLDAGLTQTTLARRARVSVRAVQHLEHSLGQPQRETTRRLAEALGLTAECRDQFERAATPAPRSRAASGRIGERGAREREPWDSRTGEAPGPPTDLDGEYK